MYISFYIVGILWTEEGRISLYKGTCFFTVHMTLNTLNLESQARDVFFAAGFIVATGIKYNLFIIMKPVMSQQIIRNEMCLHLVVK